MKIAILGVAHVHARQLIEISRNKPQFDVVGIWDREPERAAALAGAFGMPFRESIDSLLAEKPDCAFVFSENRYHRELCLRAAASVKNILCEKPLATNYRDAAEMVETCERRGVNLKVAFNNRFTAPAGQAAKLLREGKLGPVLGISGTNHGRNPGGWFTDPALAGGGALVDHTVHLVDLVYWLTGLKPVSVYAQTGTLFNDIVCEDCGFLAAELEGGIPFTVDFSWSRPEGFPAEGDNKLEIQCAGGVCLIDNRGGMPREMYFRGLRTLFVRQQRL
jgi:predicted dehydrogenase